MKLFCILSLCLLLPCNILCLKDPLDTSFPALTSIQGLVLNNTDLTPRQLPSNTTTDNENTVTENGSDLTRGIQDESTSHSAHITADPTPTSSLPPPPPPPDSTTDALYNESDYIAAAPTRENKDQPDSTSAQPTPTASPDQPSSNPQDTLESQSSPTDIPTPEPTTIITTVTSLVEPAVTSISPTLVLGDLECATDSLAQSNGRCPTNHYCNAPLKLCIAKVNNGQLCAADFQCQSGYCVGTCDNRPHPASTALNGGQLVGITLGSIGGAIALVVGLLYCHRRRKRRLAVKRNIILHSKTEMADTNPRLSKYNYLTQILDENKHDKIPTTSDYNYEFYASSLHLPHSSSSSSSGTALRPRPIIGDLTPPPSIFPSSASHDPTDSDFQSIDPHHNYSLDYRFTTNRDSMTDTTLSSSLYPPLPPPATNPLWDDALPTPRHQGPYLF